MNLYTNIDLLFVAHVLDPVVQFACLNSDTVTLNPVFNMLQRFGTRCSSEVMHSEGMKRSPQIILREEFADVFDQMRVCARHFNLSILRLTGGD